MIKILTRRPKEYLEQGLTQCGAYSVKAILNAYGKDDKKHPRDYNLHFLGKYTSITGNNTWPKVLRSYGVPAQKRSNTRNLSNEERIELLKKIIDEDKMVMLWIGNGYSKNGKYSPFRAFFVGHWITLWGYNDGEKVFYIYDAYVSLKRHDKTIPIGNTKRTYAEIIRDWGKGFPFTRRYDYIKVG